MALITKRELVQLLQVHYIIELILALAYPIIKSIPWASTRVFGSSEYSSVCYNFLLSFPPIDHSLIMTNDNSNFCYNILKTGRDRIVDVYIYLDSIQDQTPGPC